MAKSFLKSFRNKFVFLVAFFVIVNIHSSRAQIWKKIKDKGKQIQDAAKQVTTTTKEVTGTVKSFKELQKSWVKDTSSNIKYRQIPDYRNRDEITINKKQKLSIENGEFQNLSWKPVTKFDNQIFPSFIISWSTYKGEKTEDMGSSLGFYINTNLSNVVLKWEIESVDKSFFNIDSGFIKYEDMRSTNYFMPRISWNFKQLTKHSTNSPINVYFRLVDPVSGDKVEKLINVDLRSINDCLLYYGGNAYNYLFASYVNEEHPEIANILKKMLDTKMVDNILGYQWGPEFVDLQVAALWRVLHERGFQYSDITNTSGFNDATGKGVFSQTVRTFENSLQTNQANCVDGTVFIASVLKRMNIKPILINVPGHCFLGYYMNDTTTTNIHYLETTMMASSSYVTNPKGCIKQFADKYKKSVDDINKLLAGLLPKGIKLSEINKAYYLEFLDAKIEGTYKFNTNMEKYGVDKVKQLDVSQLRAYVKPIPYYE
jgi:transposase